MFLARWGVLSVLLVAAVGCATNPAADPDSRALAFMEQRASQIEANREAIDVLTARLQTVGERTSTSEASMTQLADELLSTREEMEERLVELRGLKGEMEMAQARLAAMTDAVKELHAWTQGILKNRNDLEDVQEQVGQAHERMDVLAEAVEGVRATGAALADARERLTRLDESVKDAREPLAELQKTTAELSKRTAGVERARGVIQKLVQSQYDTVRELDSLKASLKASLSRRGDETQDADGPAARLEAILSRLGQMSLSASEAGREVDEMRGLIKVLDKRLRAIETEPPGDASE